MRSLPRAASFSRKRSVALIALFLPLAPAAAFAAAATVSQSSNLRSGPATSYDVVGQLPAGEAVDVRQCEGTFCQVAYDGKSGWVSASFLTRGGVPSTTPAATTSGPQVAAIVPHKPTTTLIEPQAAPIAPHKSAISPVEPQVASVTPRQTAPAPSARPSAVLPRAYPAAAPPLPAASDMDETNGDEAALSDAPRPKVDIPGDAMRASGSDDDFASTDDPDDSDVMAPDDDNGPDDDASVAPPPDLDSRGMAPRGFRRDFAGLDVGPARACFIDADGGNGFCVREGEKIADPGRWSRHAMLLRNPQRLNVIVCVAPDDCNTYVASGPVLVGGRPIATISVAAPGY